MLPRGSGANRKMAIKLWKAQGASANTADTKLHVFQLPWYYNVNDTFSSCLLLVTFSSNSSRRWLRCVHHNTRRLTFISFSTARSPTPLIFAQYTCKRACPIWLCAKMLSPTNYIRNQRWSRPPSPPGSGKNSVCYECSHRVMYLSSRPTRKTSTENS